MPEYVRVLETEESRKEKEKNRQQQAYYAAAGAEQNCADSVGTLLPERAGQCRERLRIVGKVYPPPDTEKERWPKDGEEGKKIKYLTVEEAESLYNEIHKATYWWVKFAAKSSPEQTDDVILISDGETLIMQREKDVIVPSTHLESATNAVAPKFTQLPGVSRKVTSYVQTYPFALLHRDEANRNEYIAQKRKGDKDTADFIKKFGWDAQPDAGE